MRKRKIRRKTHLCPNCETVLERDENYCHVCGQENHNLNVPMKDLIMEFIGSITFFETKFIDTASIIFTHPGKLTLDFNSGKRVKYMHPVRMYFWVSAIFFFVLGTDFSNKTNHLKPQDVKADSIRNIERYRQAKSFEVSVIKNIKKNVAKTWKDDRDSTQKYFQGKRNREVNLDSTKKKSPYYIYLGLFKRVKIDKDSITYYYNLSDEQLDSVLKAKQITLFFSVRKTIKNSIEKEYNRYIQEKYGINNFPDRKTEIFGSLLPTLMFIMLPFAAFILWFFERHTKWRFYFQHLVFTLNTHSAIFLFWGIVAFLSDFFAWVFSSNPNKESTPYLLIFIITASLIYFLISLKKVYQQSWWKTILKFFLLIASYSLSFALIIMLGIISGLIKF